MSTSTKSEFGKWRSFLWPIHNFELKKLLPMFFMFFLISFNYTILRDTKDTLIVTAPGSGAEAIPFLKFWGVVPIAVIFMLVYAKLSNKLSKEKLFYATITPFITFFALFALVFYPFREALHPTTFADTLEKLLPAGFMGLVAVIRNWTFSMFYIMAELWGSMALSLVFWGFANDIMRIKEAKRFYAVLALGANLALLASGPLIIYFSNIRKKVPEGVDAWGITLNYLMTSVVIAGFLIIGIYYWMNRKVLTDPRFYEATEQKKGKKAKPKMSIKESFKYLMRSKYIGCIAILVMAYGISINIIEVTWKSQLKLAYPNSNDYSAFMGKFSTMGGALNSLMTLFIGGNIVRRFGWGVAALVTPIILLITGMIFFSSMLFRDNLTGFLAMIGTTPLMLAVIVGMLQNLMSKSCKYSLFDPTKEMAYIPLDQESKVKGKAAIDVVGARLGKSGGSLIQQGLLLGLGGSIIAITPYVAVILVGVIALWIFAAKSLNKQFLDISSQKEKEQEEKEREEQEAVEQQEESTSSESAVRKEASTPAS